MVTSTKNQNEQQKAITSNKRHLLVLVFEIGLILFQKQERTTKSSKDNERQMETRTKNLNEQQKAINSIFHSHFHSFAPILNLWKVADIKSNEKPERGTTCNENNEKHQKATKSNKKQQRTSELEKPERSRKNQGEQLKAQKFQMETRLKTQNHKVRFN